MDRQISQSTKIKRTLWRSFSVILVLGVAMAALAYGPRLLKPTIGRAEFRTARVEAGPIEATINSTGVVVPDFEQVISSPVNGRILRVLKRPGDPVRRGDAILELDVSEATLALEKLKQQIDLKQNQQAKARLDLQNTLNTLRSQWEIKNLDYEAAKASTGRNRKLKELGLLSAEQLHETEIREEKIAFELKQLSAAQQNAEASTTTQLEGLDLEMKSLLNEQADMERQLELATTKADRDGVLTWVITETGTSVLKGALLARIADLSSFRVDATVSDIHSRRLSVGLPATIKINDELLSGTVSVINPTIKDGVMTVGITLVEKSSPLLKSNLRVDTLIVTDRKSQALKVRKGVFAATDGVESVFVVRGNRLVKQPVKFGISGFDTLEVLSGLVEGDEVVISDMKEYQHMRDIQIR